LGKQLAAAEKERDGAAKKLSNQGFLAKAPDNVVASMRERSQSAEAEIARLKDQLQALDVS
jgi:valyl-tRNA synthetase